MIKTIRIRNFKAFVDTQMCQIGKLTVLTGINGRGKSSFLQMLLLLSQSLRQSDGSPTVLYPFGDWVNLGEYKDLENVYSKEPIVFVFKTDAERECEFELLYKASEEKESWGELISCKIDGLESMAESGEATQKNTELSKENVSESLMEADGKMGLSIEKTPVARTVYSDLTELQKLQRIYFISSDRVSAPNEEDLQPVRKQLYLGARGQYVLNVLKQCTEQQLEDLRYMMNDILEGATLDFETDTTGGRIRLYLDAVQNGRQYHPVNVGYGYSYIISSLLSIVLSKAGDTIIMENPEAHLHPKAQAILMQYIVKTINKKQVQVFVETHSDHIVNASLLAVKSKKYLTRKDVEVLFFDRDEDFRKGVYVTNLDLTESGRVKCPPKGFCDQYAMDLRELMRASYAKSE